VLPGRRHREPARHEFRDSPCPPHCPDRQGRAGDADRILGDNLDTLPFFFFQVKGFFAGKTNLD